jgi:hypothetical protein
VELAELKGVALEEKSQGCMINKRRALTELETTSYYQDNKARFNMLSSDFFALKTTQEQERKQMEELMLRNEQFVKGQQVFCTVLGELREKITTLAMRMICLQGKYRKF